MYPRIDIGSVHIFVFGIFLAISWVIFFYSLHKYSLKKGMKKHIFSDIIPFTFSIFFFSRLFYIIGQWRTEKFLFVDLMEGKPWSEFLLQLLIPANYNLSFAGGVFGFFLVFFLKTFHSKYRLQYLDIIVTAFFLWAVIGYFGALLGGQIYGQPFESFFSLTYTNKYSPVAFQQQTFPLPIAYMLLSGALYVASRKMLFKQTLPDGYVGYMMLGIFGIFLVLLEFLSGSEDMIESYTLIGLNMNQVVGIFFVVIAFSWITRLIRS